MSKVRGKLGILKYAVGGIEGGSWEELTNVRDLDMPSTKGETDISTRADGSYVTRMALDKDVSVTWDMLFDDEDEGFLAIRDAYNDDEIIGLQVYHYDGSAYFQADFEIYDFSLTQNKDEAQVYSVVAKIRANPSWEE